jgi:hypothetical protein
MAVLRKYFSFLFLLLFLGCGGEKPKQNIPKTISAPIIDTMHFHVLKPPSYFVLDSYDSNYVAWVNPKFDKIKSRKEICLKIININYGKEEEVTFFNFSRTYLMASPEGPVDPPDTGCDKLNIKYDIQKKEYTIEYDFASNPGIQFGSDTRYYDSLMQADSILKLWGAKPLSEW